MKYLLIITDMLIACLFMANKIELNNFLIAGIYLQIAALICFEKERC
mgnify:CR=1 FL=1